jgi:hypothetical protein
VTGQKEVGTEVSVEESETAQQSEAMMAVAAKDPAIGLPSLPEPFTPSIQRTLNMSGAKGLNTPPKLPEGLTVGILKSRLEGKKVKCVMDLQCPHSAANYSAIYSEEQF